MHEVYMVARENQLRDVNPLWNVVKFGYVLKFKAHVGVRKSFRSMFGRARVGLCWLTWISDLYAVRTWVLSQYWFLDLLLLPKVLWQLPPLSRKTQLVFLPKRRRAVSLAEIPSEFFLDYLMTRLHGMDSQIVTRLSKKTVCVADADS